jgi:hypothetical protein
MCRALIMCAQHQLLLWQCSSRLAEQITQLLLSFTSQGNLCLATNTDEALAEHVAHSPFRIPPAVVEAHCRAEAAGSRSRHQLDLCLENSDRLQPGLTTLRILQASVHSTVFVFTRVLCPPNTACCACRTT